MKKLIVLLSILVFVVTGCSVYVVNNDDLNVTIETIMYKSKNLYNVNYEGYKYYVPNGMKFINKEEYNAIFRDRYNNYYYVYVDAVSYYHKIEVEYETNSSKYLSKKLSNGKKFGYFEISEEEDSYFIEAMYNYMKVEAYVDKDSLESAVINICYMMSNVKYNRKVLGTLIGNEKLSYKEEKFSIFQPNENSTNFLDYVEEYEKDAEKDTKQASDEENLRIDSVE